MPIYIGSNKIILPDNLKKVMFGLDVVYEQALGVTNLEPAGDCEDLKYFQDPYYGCDMSLDGGQAVVGSSVIKAANGDGGNAVCRDVSERPQQLEAGKYYCISAYVTNDKALTISIRFQNQGCMSSTTEEYFNASADNMQRFHRKFQADNNGFLKWEIFSWDNSSEYILVDAVMLEEITQKQYNDSGFLPSDYVSP